MNIHMILRIFKQYILLVEIFIFYITVKEAEVINFKSKVKLEIQRKSKIKKMFLRTYMHFLMVEKEFLKLLKAKYFKTDKSYILCIEEKNLLRKYITK